MFCQQMILFLDSSYKINPYNLVLYRTKNLPPKNSCLLIVIFTTEWKLQKYNNNNNKKSL